MYLGNLAREGALHDAVRMAKRGTEVMPAFIAFLHATAAFDIAFASQAVGRVSVYTKQERIGDPPGRVVVIVTAPSESDKEIELRAQKARKLGAQCVVIVVPHLIRLDRAPVYLHAVDVVFYTLPWVGSDGHTPGLPRCYPLRARSYTP